MDEEKGKIRSASEYMQTGYVFVDKRMKRMNEVTSVDGNGARYGGRGCGGFDEC